jgi:hypothetical protein
MLGGLSWNMRAGWAHVQSEVGGAEKGSRRLLCPCAQRRFAVAASSAGEAEHGAHAAGIVLGPLLEVSLDLRLCRLMLKTLDVAKCVMARLRAVDLGPDLLARQLRLDDFCRE